MDSQDVSGTEIVHNLIFIPILPCWGLVRAFELTKKLMLGVIQYAVPKNTEKIERKW